MRTTKKKHPDLKKSDRLRDTIDELFRGKIGNRYTDTELEKKYKEAEKRLEWRIPPGYEDEGKKGLKKYGDTILWFQIVEHACSQQRSIIFVTDDTKEDWWLLHRDRPNQEHPQPMGPRPELRQEMFLKAGVPFFMYQGYQFVAKAQKFLDLRYQKEVIKDIRDVGQQSDTVSATQHELARKEIEIIRALGGFDPATRQYIASMLPSADPDRENHLAEARTLFGILRSKFGSKAFPDADAINAIAESTSEEETNAKYSCDRCGKPMSAQEYDQISICVDCWKEVTYERDNEE